MTEPEEQQNVPHDKNQNFKKHHHENHISQKFDELNKKIKELDEELKNTKSELEVAKKQASQYLNTASYYKTEAETNKKDFERYKERNKDIETQASKKANESVAKKLLPVLDNFDQAMRQVDSSVMQGFAMIYNSLTQTITELGVVEIACKNEKLNPEFHNCINTEKTDDESKEDVIATVYQKGYKFSESNEVIRPATVSVYKL
ncbi:MAG: nucleotide exchange factor GrpE [Clostridia bacterium]|nr:nucleotide exchange factor GrpE [Clostridia bacterium]